MNKAKNARLIEGPVGAAMINLTLPMVFSVLAMVAFNLVDTFYIGQLGTVELAAMSFTFPVVFFISSLIQGVGVGASAVIARTVGEGEHRRVQQLTTYTMLFALLMVSILSGIGLLTMDPLFRTLGATDEVLPHIRDYMAIWYVSLAIMVVPMIGNAALRGTGDTRSPAVMMIVAVIVNAVLDPIMIFGLGMGVPGAALATMLAHGLITFTWSLRLLIVREKLLTFIRPTLREMLAAWKAVLYVGLPAAATNMLVPLSTGIITGMVAAYGTEAVAAYGVASRIEVFGLALITALGATLTAFVGQNWGAGKNSRVRLCIRYSQQFAVIWGVFLFILLVGFREPLAGVFNSDPQVIAILSAYLIIVSLSYIFQSLLLVGNSALNALNKPLHSAALMALRLLGLYVPLALLGSQFFGLIGIFGAAALANVASGLVAVWWLRGILHKDTAYVHSAPLAVGIRSG